MLKYIGRRLGQLIPTLLGVSVLVFFGMHLVPGDVAQLLLGDKGTEADLQRLRHQLGLDQPVYVQYFRFLLGPGPATFAGPPGPPKPPTGKSARPCRVTTKPALPPRRSPLASG